MHSMRPDCLLLTCTLQKRDTFAALVEWDTRIRNMSALSELPPRIWVFLVGDGKHSHSPNNMDVYDDIYRALNSMPLEERPVTFEVVCLRSCFGRRMRKVATKAVARAVKNRLLVTEDDIPTQQREQVPYQQQTAHQARQDLQQHHFQQIRQQQHITTEEDAISLGVSAVHVTDENIGITARSSISLQRTTTNSNS